MERNNVADFRVTLDGKDLTDKIAPRLISLSLTEKRGGEADQLDLVLHDHDGKLVIPKEGATIQVQLGWAGPGITDGSLTSAGWMTTYFGFPWKFTAIIRIAAKATTR